MSRIDLPLDIEEAVLSLKGLGELITATEWKRAAIVWAFTEDRQGQKDTSHRSVQGLGLQEFADLKLEGLKSRNSVAKYRKAWQRAIDVGAAKDVQPGQRVTLPDLEWQEYFNPPMPPVDRESKPQKPKKPKKPTEEPIVPIEIIDTWNDEMGVDRQVLKYSERMWEVIEDIEERGPEGAMWSRIANRAADVFMEENKKMACLQLFDAITELASARNTELRSISS